MMEAAAITPIFDPSAAWPEKPNGMKGVKWVGLKARAATITKAVRATTLITTSMTLSVALSLVPTISTPATTKAISTAGRLMIPPPAGPARS